MHLFICIDGCDPRYLEAADTPILDSLAAQGFKKTVSAVVPSVTNVNNISIVTGRFPSEHGIVGNYWLDGGHGRFMESSDDLCCDTVLQQANAAGLRTALVTSKQKLLNMIGQGVNVSVAAENPGTEWHMIGPTRDVYSMEINLWSFNAAHHILKTHSPDLLYLSTTDYIMHTYPPEHDTARLHLEKMDEILGRIMNDFPDLSVTVTADHGMNHKSVGVDLARVLTAGGVDSTVVPIIKDRYVQHHFNQGGAAYVYLKNPETISPATDILRGVEGIDEVIPRTDAASRYGLMGERIGDLLVLGDAQTVFGEYDLERTQVDVRTHGSHHEATVPFITNNTTLAQDTINHNLDTGRQAISCIGLHGHPEH